MKAIINKALQVLNIFFVVLTLVILIIAFAKPGWIEIALDWVQQLVKSLGNWNYLVIFITSIIESFPFLWVVVPGMNVMILVGGFFIGKDMWIFLNCFTIAATGACLGNATGFILGKYAGREFLQKHGMWFGIGATEMKYIEKIMKKKGFWFIVFAKFHGMLRAFIPYIAWAAKMNTKKFWLYNLIWAVIWSACILLLGIFFIENYELILKYFSWIFIWAIVIIMAYMMKFHRSKLDSYFRQKNEEIDQRSRN